MKRYKAHWYNAEKVVKEDIVEAEDEKEAERQAYILYNGDPPTSEVWIMELDD
jgi:hypothetical protein